MHRTPPPLTALAVVTLLSLPPAELAGQAGAPVEVPLSWVDGLLVVPVSTADGQDARFIVSTGAARTVLSESAAARLGAAPELALGGIPVPTDGLSVLPDARLTAGKSVLDGMIGANLLSDFDVLVDVPGGRLVLKPLARDVAWEGVSLSDPVRLRVMHGTALLLDVQLGDATFPAMIDLGSPATVVSEGVRTELGLGDDDARPLRIGQTTIPELEVQVRHLDVFDMWAPNGEGVIVLGSGWVERCVVSLSWVHAEIRTCAS